MNRKMLIGMAAVWHRHKVGYASFDSRNASIAKSLCGLWYSIGVAAIEAEPDDEYDETKAQADE